MKDGYGHCGISKHVIVSPETDELIKKVKDKLRLKSRDAAIHVALTRLLMNKGEQDFLKQMGAVVLVNEEVPEEPSDPNTYQWDGEKMVKVGTVDDLPQQEVEGITLPADQLERLLKREELVTPELLELRKQTMKRRDDDGSEESGQRKYQKARS